MSFHYSLSSYVSVKVECEWKPRPYYNMVSNRTLGELYKENATNLGVRFSQVPTQLPVASTDMGNVSYVVPSIHPCYEIGQTAVNHTTAFTGAAGT